MTLKAPPPSKLAQPLSDEDRQRILVLLGMGQMALAEWDEGKHPRVPAGSSHGGEFGGAGSVATGPAAVTDPDVWRRDSAGQLRPVNAGMGPGKPYSPASQALMEYWRSVAQSPDASYFPTMRMTRLWENKQPALVTIDSARKLGPVIFGGVTDQAPSDRQPTTYGSTGSTDQSATEEITGAPSHRNGLLTIDSAAGWGQAHYDGSVTMDSSFVETMRMGLQDGATPDQMADAKGAFKTLFHENIHQVGNIPGYAPEDQAYAWDAQKSTYNSPGIRTLQEGSTELYARTHLNEFIQQTGLADSQPGLLDALLPEQWQSYPSQVAAIRGLTHVVGRVTGQSSDEVLGQIVQDGGYSAALGHLADQVTDAKIDLPRDSNAYFLARDEVRNAITQHLIGGEDTSYDQFTRQRGLASRLTQIATRYKRQYPPLWGHPTMAAARQAQIDAGTLTVLS